MRCSPLAPKFEEVFFFLIYCDHVFILAWQACRTGKVKSSGVFPNDSSRMVISDLLLYNSEQLLTCSGEHNLSLIYKEVVFLENAIHISIIF